MYLIITYNLLNYLYCLVDSFFISIFIHRWKKLILMIIEKELCLGGSMVKYTKKVAKKMSS
jgi:hypothetical protein